MISMVAVSILTSISAFAAVPSKRAVPQYKVNMRVGLKGQAPLSVNTVTKSGKKAFISEISDDGQSETLIEVMAKNPNKTVVMVC